MFQRKHHEWNLAISSQVPSFELIKLLGSQERGWETENICKFQWLTCSNKVVEDTRTRELSSITFPWRSVKVMWDPQSTCLCFFFALPSVPCDPRMRSINAFTVSVWHVWPSSGKSRWVMFGNNTRRVIPFARLPTATLAYPPRPTWTHAPTYPSISSLTHVDPHTNPLTIWNIYSPDMEYLRCWPNSIVSFLTSSLCWVQRLMFLTWM